MLHATVDGISLLSLDACVFCASRAANYRAILTATWAAVQHGHCDSAAIDLNDLLLI